MTMSSRKKLMIAGLALPLAVAWVGQMQAHAGDACGGNACKVDVSSCCAKEKSQQASITPEGLKVMLSAGTPVVVLDARSGKYDDGRRIPGAKSLDAKSTAEDVAKAIPSKDSLVVTYFANVKCPAGGLLAAHLSELGYKNIIELPVGIEGWVKAGNEVTQAEKL